MKILRFTAIWCMYCLYMKSFWEEFEHELNSVQIEEFDADDNSDMHKKFNIKDVPTVIITDDNDHELIRIEGAKEKDELKRLIQDTIKK